MKILHVSQSDIDGGAAKAAHRLCIAQRSNQLRVELFVMRKFSQSSFVFTKPGLFSLAISRVLPQLDRLAKKILGILKGRSWSLNLISNPSLKIANFYEYDLIHLHWVGKNMLNLKIIEKFDKPIVWTLHDSWPFTAGCHIPDTCDAYKYGCPKCPQLSNELFGTAMLKFMHDLKSTTYKNKKINFVAPSRWIADQAKSSQLLKNCSIHVIPNSICTKTFFPSIKSECAEHFNLPLDKNIILFGAMYADTDHNKGMDLLLKALESLCDSDTEFKDNSVLVLFGASLNITVPIRDLKVVSLGTIHDQSKLAKLYSAATLTVVPSRSESFGQVAAESLSCGTPVVAFRYSGLIDIVDHCKNGYLASPYDAQDLARGINYLISRKLDTGIREFARNKVIKHFDSDFIAMAHHELYKSIVTKA